MAKVYQVEILMGDDECMIWSVEVPDGDDPELVLREFAAHVGGQVVEFWIR